MGRTAKPRKAYRPKGATIDAVDYTIALACKLGPPQRASLRNPLRAALTNLRTGRDTASAWCELADGMNVAEQLAHRGIVSDRLQVFLQAQAALHAVNTRNQQRGTMTLRAEELAALRLGRFFHFVQLDYCTQGEMQAAIEAVKRKVQQALAGNAPRDARICVGGLRGRPGQAVGAAC
jgi:hypothetical protein